MYQFRKIFVFFVLSQTLQVNAVEPEDLIFSDGFEVCKSDPMVPVDALHWDGGGDKSSWSDPLNWAGDTLPVDGDAVSIRINGAITVVYDASLGTTRISGLDSCE